MAKDQAVAAADKVTEAEKTLASANAELKKCSADVTVQEKLLQAALAEEAQANDYVQQLDSGLEELQHVLENDTVKPIADVPEPVVETVPAVVPIVAKSEHLPAVLPIESISIG